jgi:hypothetical protein
MTRSWFLVPSSPLPKKAYGIKCLNTARQKAETDGAGVAKSIIDDSALV